MLPQNFFIFILFYDFYRRTYNKPTAQVIESATKAGLNNNEGSSKLKAKVKLQKTSILNYDKTISD